MADNKCVQNASDATLTYRKMIRMLQAHLEIEKKYWGEYAVIPYEAEQNNVDEQSLAVDKDCAKKLATIANEAAGCTRCNLAKGRTQVVFGCGSPFADLVVVGEAPGYYEDKQGIPFVGKAGQLLTKMLAGIALSRDQVYICNVIKCHPPENRDPLPDEVMACDYWFSQQLELLKPKLLFAVGKFAAQALSGATQFMWQYRGNIYHYQGIPVICTYHPAYLLRNEGEKRKAWQDLKKARQMLDTL